MILPPLFFWPNKRKHTGLMLLCCQLAKVRCVHPTSLVLCPARCMTTCFALPNQQQKPSVYHVPDGLRYAAGVRHSEWRGTHCEGLDCRDNAAKQSGDTGAPSVLFHIKARAVTIAE